MRYTLARTLLLSVAAPRSLGAVGGVELVSGGVMARVLRVPGAGEARGEVPSKRSSCAGAEEVIRPPSSTGTTFGETLFLDSKEPMAMGCQARVNQDWLCCTPCAQWRLAVV